MPARSGPLTLPINPLFLELSLPAPLPTLLTLLLWLVAGLTSLVSLLGFLSRRDWKFELCSHFRLQYTLLLGVCAAGFILVSDLPGALFSLAFLGGNLGLILPIYRRPARGEREGKATRLFFANILGTNTNYQRLRQSILAANADIIVLVEVRPSHLQALLPALSGYPYQFTLPDNHNFGIALFSRLPLESAQALAFDARCTPALVARLGLDSVQLTLLGIHPYPPKSHAQAARRDHQLKLTASFAADQPGELLLVGDLNATSWSYVFQKLLHTSRLLDSRQGFGLQPSWPAGNPLLRIPIDHALHTPDIGIQARRLGLPTGSDHLPVIVDFSIIKP
jgi:endonuclease/exonuclease/phosphatase (EEP) superfamily protein YafD